MASEIFGDAIDLAPVRFRLGKWFFLQPARTIMAPDGHIWLHPNGGFWRDDYSEEPIWLRALIMHEFTHVWQHQQCVFLPLKRHPFCRYGYEFTPGKPFAKYGLEQQGELVRHAYLQLHGKRLAGRPDLAAYRETLPFGDGAAQA
ncbi:MAG: vgr related protein [Pacificimonas sp.]|jgi:hypothetical protein|nr:vgr related protein [Pacificimonas sp.]